MGFCLEKKSDYVLVLEKKNRLNRISISIKPLLSHRADMACLVLSGATVPFNDLVSGITRELVTSLKDRGIETVSIQYGHADSAFRDGPANISGVSGFAFDPDLIRRIKRARLVISHAGTGSILDTLRDNPGTPLIVVPNESLMDNHQLEVANQLQPRYLLVSKVENLTETVKKALDTKFEVLAAAQSIDNVILDVLK